MNSHMEAVCSSDSVLSAPCTGKGPLHQQPGTTHRSSVSSSRHSAAASSSASSSAGRPSGCPAAAHSRLSSAAMTCRTACLPRTFLVSLPLLLGVLGLLLLHAGGAAAERPPPPLHQGCPAWLQEYIQFHKTMKYHPDAKYLLYDCSSHACMGLADRLRGIMWLLRYAAHSQRVLLVRMTIPVPIESFFAPTWIDWRVGVAGPNNEALEVPQALTMWPNDLDKESGLQSIKAMTEKWIGGVTNGQEFMPMPSTYPVGEFSRNGSCIFQALFMASEEAETFVEQHYATMQVNPSRPYIAIHLRTYQMVGEGESTPHSLESEERVLTSLMCVRTMAPKCGVDLATNPAVLITDGLHIRRRVSLRLYDRLTTAPIQPHHFDTAGRGAEVHDRHMETIADFIVLSRASGLFYDKNSGFSRMAAYLGGHTNPTTNPCLMDNHDCAKWRPVLDYRMPVPPPGQEPNGTRSNRGRRSASAGRAAGGDSFL